MYMNNNLLSDDKGKLHELLLGKYLNPSNKLPSHHRGNCEKYIGTPIEIHKKLLAKIGKIEYNIINKNSKETAVAIKEYLTKNKYISKRNVIVDVYWTSNRDTVNSPGDHEKTTGIRDVNSNADLMILMSNKSYIGISAKYGSQKPGFRNSGLVELAKTSGNDPAIYLNMYKNHLIQMEKYGYVGTAEDKHKLYKKDSTAKLLHHKKYENLNKSAPLFVPKTIASKRAQKAEEASVVLRTTMARLNEMGLSNLSDNKLRKFIKSVISPQTIFPHIISHCKIQSDKSIKPEIQHSDELIDDHLAKFKKLHIKPGNGIASVICGINKSTGKVGRVSEQTFKSISGPVKNIAGVFKLC